MINSRLRVELEAARAEIAALKAKLDETERQLQAEKKERFAAEDELAALKSQPGWELDVTWQDLYNTYQTKLCGLQGSWEAILDLCRSRIRPAAPYGGWHFDAGKITPNGMPEGVTPGVPSVEELANLICKTECETNKILRKQEVEDLDLIVAAAIRDRVIAGMGVGRDIHPRLNPDKPKQEQGVYSKFHVTRTDGKDAPGCKHDGCQYFVLDRTHDKFAGPALTAYALACADEYPVLSRELLEAYLVAPSTYTDADVEALARVLCAAYCESNKNYGKEWDSLRATGRYHYMAEARAALDWMGAPTGECKECEKLRKRGDKWADDCVKLAGAIKNARAALEGE